MSKSAQTPNIKQSFKKLLDPGPDLLQNLTGPKLGQDPALVNFHANRFISFFVKLLTPTQTQKPAKGKSKSLLGS